MLSKALAGGLTAAVLALAIVFWLLLSAKEANGVLTQGIESARGVNARQAAVQAELQANHNNLLVQMENERRKTRIATDALELVQLDLVKNKADFDQRIKAAVTEMTDEELVCAAELVPAGLIDSLWADASGADGP